MRSNNIFEKIYLQTIINESESSVKDSDIKVIAERDGFRLGVDSSGNYYYNDGDNALFAAAKR